MRTWQKIRETSHHIFNSQKHFASHPHSDLIYCTLGTWLPEEEQDEMIFLMVWCYYITSVDEGYVAEFGGWLYVDGASVGI